MKLKNSHAVKHGPTLQDKIEKLMDKTNERSRFGTNQDINYARLEGMAATLAILRNIPEKPSSVKIEIDKSNVRCGYDN